MDGQFMRQFQVWDSSMSFHYTFDPHSAICQVSLAADYDHDNWAVPISPATVVFTSMTTTKGKTDLLGEQGLVHAFVATDLTELEGMLLGYNCYAGAILNVFWWAAVS